jgi:hypothetical protein
MGVDAADFDNDGWLDLFVSNIDRERFALYRNNGDNTFTDQADVSGIGQASHYLSGWGLRFFDYDNDGNVDLFLANGHPDEYVDTYSTNVKWAEPLLLFHNDGAKWRNVSASAGPAFQKRWPARGMATGDFDNDGGLDVLVSNNGATPLLLHNRVGRANNWLGLKLVGAEANIDGVGARITWGFGGQTRSIWKTGGGSYLSAHDPRVVLGIGRAPRFDFVEIRWPRPSTRVERLTSLPLNRYVVVVEGKGIGG